MLGLTPHQTCQHTIPELWVQFRALQRARGIDPDPVQIDDDVIRDWEAKIKAIHHAKGHYDVYPKED